jgi:chromosome segregation protein
VAITRRVYRDGAGEYLLNGEPTRLGDIQVLLSEAGVAQKTYAVIGQGMIDSVILASPEERKVFFDEATGVRALFLRRTQAVNKLQRAEANLEEGRRILGELEPRWQLLNKAMERLQRRVQIEERLATVTVRYFGGRRLKIEANLRTASLKFTEAEKRVQRAEGDYQLIDQELSAYLAQARTQEAALQTKSAERLADYQRLQNLVRGAEQALVKAEHAVSLARATAKASWAPLPYEELLIEIDRWLEGATAGIEVGILIEQMRNLRKRLAKPVDTDVVIDADLLRAVEEAREAVRTQEASLAAWQLAAEKQTETQEGPDGQGIQERLRLARVLVQQGQAELSQARVERSLAEEAQQALEQEIRENVATYTGLIGAMNESVPGEELEALGREYRSLQREAALIGALDPEMEQEYSAVTERVNFYRVQIDDLSQAIQQTTSLLRELDQEIKQKGEGAFEALAEAFARAFKELFKGGQAALKLQASSGENEGEVLMGVEIEATPPGKKLKSLALLSGGERALTALALLMAIMETNPAPFILLDEVDAALDEANTRRFADMLAKLKEKTQFLVITHNRATMEVGDALYGVNMGRDGTSRLISVTLADYGQETTARR